MRSAAGVVRVAVACCSAVAVLAVLVAEPPRRRPRRATTLASIRPSPSCRRFSTRLVAALGGRGPDAAAGRRAHRAARPEPRRCAAAGAAPRGHADLPGQRRQVRLPDGRLRLAGAGQAAASTRELDDLLTQMIHESSNQATQEVFARLTGTTPGPALRARGLRRVPRSPARRGALAATRSASRICTASTRPTTATATSSVATSSSSPTAVGGLPAPRRTSSPNRNAMTAVGTAKLLALLATDRALSPRDSATVRRRMRRDPTEQPHLAAPHRRRRGPSARPRGLREERHVGADLRRRRHRAQPFGTAVRARRVHRGAPPYRGDFIADLTEHLAAAMLASPAHPERRGERERGL